MDRTQRFSVALCFSSIWVIAAAVQGVSARAEGVLSAESGTPEYKLPPVNPRALTKAEDHPWKNKDVKNIHGRSIGTIDHILIDARTGKEQYVMVKGDKPELIQLPFEYFTERRASVILDVSKEDIQRGGPDVSE